MVRIIRNIVMLLLGLLVIAAAIIWWMLQQSLPVLQGVQPAALKSAVTVSRDEHGYLTIRATNQRMPSIALVSATRRTVFSDGFAAAYALVSWLSCLARRHCQPIKNAASIVFAIVLN